MVPAAVLLSLVSVAQAVIAAGRTGNFALTLVLAIAVTVPVVLIRDQPGLALLLISTSCFVAVLSGGQPTYAGLIALCWTLYAAGRQCERQTLLLLAVPVVGFGVASAFLRPAFAVLAVAATAFAAGSIRRARADAVAREATVQAMTDTLVDHLARGERARIARELHDVVAHHISLIALQADAVRLTTAGLPPEGAKGLTAIGDTARAALTEMRRLLGVLREDAEAGPDRRPQPGLEQLNELLDATREVTGGGARLIVQGPVRALDPGLELTAYRIVQEALTNARRHAPGAGVDVDLVYRHDALQVRVRDNGPARLADNDSPDGHGLTGMRERVAMLGGSLAAGPARPYGFLVEAVLPIPGDR